MISSQKVINSQKANVKVLVPIPRATKDLADLKAKKIGFGSLQDAIRFLVTNFANDQLNVSLSSANEEILAPVTPEYAKYILERERETEEAIKNGTSYTANSVDELMDILNNTEVD